jgi:hypothetical protein
MKLSCIEQPINPNVTFLTIKAQYAYRLISLQRGKHVFNNVVIIDFEHLRCLLPDKNCIECKKIVTEVVFLYLLMNDKKIYFYKMMIYAYFLLDTLAGNEKFKESLLDNLKRFQLNAVLRKDSTFTSTSGDKTGSASKESAFLTASLNNKSM